MANLVKTMYGRAVKKVLQSRALPQPPATMPKSDADWTTVRGLMRDMITEIQRLQARVDELESK